MREGWKRVAISDLCIMIKRGQAPSYTESKSVTVVNQKCVRDGRVDLTFSRQTDANLKPVSEWAYLNSSDTLVNSTGVGTLGRVAFVRNISEPTTVDSHVTIVRPDDKKVEPSFLGLSLNFREADIEGLAVGSSGQTELSREALGNLIIMLPTLPEQKRIVDLISSVDSYIEALQQQLESAKRSRNAVLHELLTAGGDDWVETTLDRVTECSWGNTETTKSKYVESGFLAYSASGADGFLDWFEHDRTAVVLSAIGAQCGKTWFAEGKWTSIKNTIWLKSDNSNLLDKYLFYLSNTDQFWQIRGQAQPFISLGDVKKTRVLLPPLREQERIVEVISEMDAFFESIQRTSMEAKNLRSGLLSDLLSGSYEIPTTYDKVIGAA